ncbi:hypothetical protein FACS1894122_05350 [Alphaproteobacteria bacterium]|nr:hypothetical protein FACS1894122_05350 [Alphaproteobacteria bacterium]
MKEAFENAFNDVFEHLGIEVIFKPANASSFPIIALLKEPESVYEVGSSQVIGQVAEFSMKASDVKPKVGDSIFVGAKKYKIHEEPLLDASNFAWKFNAILKGIENV